MQSLEEWRAHSPPTFSGIFSIAKQQMNCAFSLHGRDQKDQMNMREGVKRVYIICRAIIYFYKFKIM